MANEATVTVTRSAQIGGQTVGGTQERLLADFQAVYKQEIAASTSNYEIDMPITVSTITALALWADHDCELYTNAISSGSPAQHISLKANVTLVCTISDGASHQILTTNVTKFYVTTGGSATNLTIAVATQAAPTGGA